MADPPNLDGIMDDGRASTIGTWQGIERSTVPAWRVPIWNSGALSSTWTVSTTLNASPNMMYFINGSSVMFSSPAHCGVIDGIGQDGIARLPDSMNPDLWLPEGL